MSKLTKMGQVAVIPLLQTGAVMLVAMVGGFFVQIRYSDSQLADFKAQVDRNNLEISQRVATLEEAIKTIKDDNKEIKSNLQELLKRTKN